MRKTITQIAGTLSLPTLVYGIFLALSPARFGNWNCVYTILLQSIIPTITAYAVAYGNICGIFDFTVGARVIISGVVGGLMATQFGMPGLILGALVASMLTSAITGALNWVLRIPSLVLTMGLTMVYEIVGKELAGRFGFVQIDNQYTFLGGSPGILVVFVLSAALFSFLFNSTKFSFHIRAIGSNELVARNTGLPVSMVKFKSFVYGGIFIAIAAILTLSQSGSVGAKTSLGSVTIVFKPLISILLALVLQQLCNLTIGIFISQLTLNIIFIGLIAVGMPDTFQNVVLGGFLLVVMIFFQNAEHFQALMERARSSRNTVKGGAA